jgi:hypothetical protein
VHRDTVGRSSWPGGDGRRAGGWRGGGEWRGSARGGGLGRPASDAHGVGAPRHREGTVERSRPPRPPPPRRAHVPRLRRPDRRLPRPAGRRRRRVAPAAPLRPPHRRLGADLPRPQPPSRR